MSPAQRFKRGKLTGMESVQKGDLELKNSLGIEQNVSRPKGFSITTQRRHEFSSMPSFLLTKLILQ